MKKNKIIGLLVACGGMVASFAAASALYVKNANQTGFGIGATYHAADGSITYRIDGKSSGSIEASYLDASGNNGGHGFGGENLKYTQAKFEFPLSAEYSLNPQPYVVGNFSIHLENIASSLQNKSKIWVQVTGWGDLTDNENPYKDKWGSSAANCNFFTEDQAITGSEFTANKDITVSSVGGQSVTVYVKLDSAVAEADILALADTVPFTISATWGAASEGYKFAYVVGNKNGWEQDDAYAMTPNLKTAGFEWYFAGLTGFENGKCNKTVIENEQPVTFWSADPDATLDSSKVYDVSWDGNRDNPGVATFSERA